jgi:hypothetical protein
MKKFVLFLAVFVTTFFNVNAQYDLLHKQGAFDQDIKGDYAYGQSNKYDNQYPRNDRNNDNYRRQDDRYDSRGGDHYHHDDDRYDSRSNVKNAVIIKKFRVERGRKDRIELEFCLSGPSAISYSTKWRGNTLMVFFDYPYNRVDDVYRNTVEVEVGRIGRGQSFNVVAFDANSRFQIGEFQVNN